MVCSYKFKGLSRLNGSLVSSCFHTEACLQGTDSQFVLPVGDVSCGEVPRIFVCFSGYIVLQVGDAGGVLGNIGGVFGDVSGVFDDLLVDGMELVACDDFGGSRSDASSCDSSDFSCSALIDVQVSEVRTVCHAYLA